MTDPSRPSEAPERNWLFMATAIALTAAAAIATFAWQTGAFEPATLTTSDDAEVAARAAGFDKQQTEAVETIIREYLLDHPEVIRDAVQVLRQREVAKRIDAVRSQIETPFAQGFIGNPNGDVTLVEFTDFACGYCRKSVEDVKKLVAADPNVKVVFRELPILSEESGTAAAWAMAAARQGKYAAFHDAMFAAGRPTDATIETAAKKAGLDLAKAKAFVDSDEAQSEINNNIAMAQQLEFSGTPSWVVGNQILSGAVGYDALKEAVAKTRADGPPA